LSQCTVDRSYSGFRRALKQLQKKFPKIDLDLQDAIDKIQKDYENACNAFCVPMPNLPDLQRRIFKYDIGSRDLRKHPRECFRLICAFLPSHGDSRILSALLLYHKSDVSNISAKDIAEEIKKLKAQLEEPHGVSD
jgi:hypothetical protein